MHGGLRTTITALAVGAILLVAGATTLVAIREYQTLYLQAAATDLDALSENLSSDLIPLLAETPDLFAATNVLLRLDQYEFVVLAAVLDQERNVVTQYVGRGLDRDGQSAPELITQRLDRAVDESAALGNAVRRQGTDFIAHKTVGEESLPLGYLLIETDVASAVEASTARLLTNVSPMTAFIIALVVFAMVYLLGRLLSPLNELSEFTERIRDSGDYSLQAPDHGTREVRELTANFNRMMREINSEVEKNRDQNEQLREQREQMEILANYDSLTGLSNRQFVMHALRRSLASARRDEGDFAVLFLDLDGFKGVNDSFGHEVGDKLLEMIGEDLQRELRDADLVSRLGGDEFLIVLDHCPEASIAMRTAERMIEAVACPRRIDGWNVQVGASVGIATARSAQYELSELMIHADVAMYHAKLNGKGTYSVFAETMAADEQRRLKIATALIPAIDNDELSLHYQPQVDREGAITGYEALLRWSSPVIGSVSPEEFVPIAERAGQINRLTRWVIHRGARDLSVLQKIAGHRVTLALNLSVHDLRNKKLATEIADVLAANNVLPGDIELEITETAYLENFDVANSIVRRLRELGCRITLDDFGTGYSSLSYLSRIKINTLKIDKQFIDRVGESERDSLLTRTIIEMAEQLGMNTIAEGVETKAQADFLIANGCDSLQGFLYGKPMSLEELKQRKGPGRLRLAT